MYIPWNTDYNNPNDNNEYVKIMTTVIVPAMVEKVLKWFKTIEELNQSYARLGPYTFAKTYDVLVDNSGEAFATEYTSWYNEVFGEFMF